MTPKRYHPTPLSGGDRKALQKHKARAMTMVLARRSGELRVEGEALIKQADKLSAWRRTKCSWERRILASSQESARRRSRPNWSQSSCPDVSAIATKPDPFGLRARFSFTI
jgi:hypothetical protein